MNKYLKLTPLLILALLVLGVAMVNATPQNTCPNHFPWVKVDSDDLSQLPDEYSDACFKFGSNNSQGCIGGLSDVWPPEVDGKHCGLSHFSYIPLLETPTPSPTPTATPSATPTVTPSPTATPSPRPSVTPSPTPTVTPSPTPTPTPTSSATPTPTPTTSSTPEPTPTPENCYTTKGGILRCS